MASLNIDQLRSFADVASSGSFSATALRHKVSQPAISFQVKQLEKRLGVRLIERIGRKAVPTAAGIELLEHVARINGEVALALESMARHATGRLAGVRLGTGATACIFLLPAVLSDLRDRLPDLEVTVTTGNTSDLVRAVEDNELDVALVTMPAAGRILAVDVVMEDEFVLIAPTGIDLPKQVTQEELREVPLILFEQSGNTRRLVDNWFADKEISPTQVMSVGSVEAIKELVGAGLGYGILPAMAMRRTEHAPSFVVRPLAPRLCRQLALVIRRDKVLHRGLREVLAAVADQCFTSRLTQDPIVLI